MPKTLTMPKLSPTMESGTIVKWHKNVADFVEVGDTLMEVATDKATVEYQAIDEGWFRQILIQEGHEAQVNQPIAIFTDTQEESLEGYQSTNISPQKPTSDEKLENFTQEIKETKETAPAKVLQQTAFVPEPPLKLEEIHPLTQSSEKKILASPLAKKIAKDKGLDLSMVKGTGPNGRVVSRDLEMARPLVKNDALEEAEKPTIAAGSYEEYPLSPMRKIIGQRLQESKSTIPHFYIRQDIDADSLVAIREQLKNGDIKISINDLIVRACALSLRRHPQLNTGFNSANQTIIQFKTIDISVAVSLQEGLITPIIRHADFKSVQKLANEIRSLAKKAREGKLEPQEYKGGSFTISNLGMYGITDFQAIINPPQAAILAVSSIQDCPVIRNNQIAIGKSLSLTLSVDHRVIDGVIAAEFLKTLKHYLENPVLLIVN